MHAIAITGPGDGWIIGDRIYGGGFRLRYTAPADAYLPALLRGALDGD